MKPVTPQKDAGCRMDPPVSDPSAQGSSQAATAAADPPDDPPGVLFRSQGLCVAPWNEVSVVLPIANSSMLVWPTITAPASSSLPTAVAS